MSKNKQTYNPCDDCRYSYTKNGQESGMCEICEFTYFKDHRQNEGKWIWKSNGYMKSLHCSCCGMQEEWETLYCPNCGAKMKGGAE